MSMADRRAKERALNNLFNLNRHPDLQDPQLSASNGYPTSATDFEGQGWRRWVNGNFRVAQVYTNEFENDDGSVDKGITITVRVAAPGEPSNGDSCRLSFRGFQKAEVWDDPNAEEDFFTRSDREQFELLFDLFCAVDPKFKEIEKQSYAEVAEQLFHQAKQTLTDKYFNGSVKLECYKPKADPETVKGPYASLDRARKLSPDAEEELGLKADMPF